MKRADSRSAERTKQDALPMEHGNSAKKNGHSQSHRNANADDEDDGFEVGALPPKLPVNLRDMEQIPGYQTNEPFVPPPTGGHQRAPPPPYQPQDFSRGLQLTQDEARQCLTAYTKKQCCWTSGAAQSMTIEAIQPSMAVHYIVSTFHESRSTEWVSVPYYGEYFESSRRQRPPDPWDIEVDKPPPFQDQTIAVEVPYTSSVKRCHMCRGRCFVRCRTCRGRGDRRCYLCNGRGHDTNGERCFSCKGYGNVTCSTCHGEQMVMCTQCDGNGEVRCYIQMTVNFATYTTQFVLERTPLPDHLILEVQGDMLFDDTREMLSPITSFPEAEVNENSVNMIRDHSRLNETSLILMQRHSIRGVPVFECHSNAKGKDFQFYVYGNDRRVYTSNYPGRPPCGSCELL